jgi:hypothetical protein
MLAKRYFYNIERKIKVNSTIILKSIIDFEKGIEELESRCCLICGEEAFTQILEIYRFGFFYPCGVCTNCGNLQQTISITSITNKIDDLFNGNVQVLIKFKYFL